MISHKHKTIFVHVPKVAGTSIEQVFLDDLNLDFGNRHALFLGVNNNNDGPRRISHLTIDQFKKYSFATEEQFDSYFKFAFVRNPIDRLFSTYKYLGYNQYLSFDKFIIKKLDFLICSEKYGFFMLSQKDYLYIDNICSVDFIGRFENIKEDFNFVKKKLNLESSLLHKNKSDHNTFMRTIKNIFFDFNIIASFSLKKRTKVLSNESKQIILKHYEDDFRLFNYTL